LPRAAAHPAEPSRECLKHATVTKPDSILTPHTPNTIPIALGFAYARFRSFCDVADCSVPSVYLRQATYNMQLMFKLTTCNLQHAGCNVCRCGLQRSVSTVRVVAVRRPQRRFAAQAQACARRRSA
jgi:hypothetical protein